MTYDNLEALIKEHMLVFKYVFQNMGYPTAIPSVATVNNLYNRDPQRFSSLLYAASISSGSNVIDYFLPSGVEEVIGPPPPPKENTTTTDKDKKESNAPGIITSIGSALGSVLGGLFGSGDTNTTNNYGKSDSNDTATYVMLGLGGVAVVGTILYFVLRKK